MSSLDGEGCSVEVSASSSNTQPWNLAFPNYGCDVIELGGWRKFKRCLEKRAMRFLKDPELQYVIVANVSIADVAHIDYLRRHCKLPQTRVLYDEEKRLMVVKLIPGVAHHIAIGLFDGLFYEMVPSSTRIIGVGSTRFGEATKRHKEPDQSFLQVYTRCPNPDWPSVVLEVGVLENLHQLREDARYWLINSDGQVFVVIIISMGLSTREMTWERWEHVPSSGPATRREIASIHPTLMQTVTLPIGGPVIGAPFWIPSNKIWDIVPNNIGAEIVFTAQDLETLSRTFVDCTQ